MPRAATVLLVGVITVALLAILGMTYLSRITEEHFPPPAPNVSTTWQDELTLTTEHPVIVRAFDVSVDPTAGRMTSPYLTIGAKPTDAGDIHPRDVWISIFDPSSGAGTPTAAGSGHATLDGWIGSARHFDGCETDACSATYVVVVRWLTPVEGTAIPVVVSADLSATLLGPVALVTPATPTPVPLPEGLSITEDPTFRFDGLPSRLTSRATGTATITAGEPESAQQFVLHVPAAALDGLLRYPLVGRALLTVDHADASSRERPPWNELTGPRGTLKGLAGIALDLEWLSACSSGQDCDVPLTLKYMFGESSADPSGTVPPDASAEASWSLEVVLESLSEDVDLSGFEITLAKVEP